MCMPTKKMEVVATIISYPPREWKFARGFVFILLVGAGRLELPRVAPYASETYAYTNSATRPKFRLHITLPRLKNNRRSAVVFVRVRGRGLAPPRLTAYAPQAYVYTVSPPARVFVKKYRFLYLISLAGQAQEFAIIIHFWQ